MRWTRLALLLPLLLSLPACPAEKSDGWSADEHSAASQLASELGMAETALLQRYVELEKHCLESRHAVLLFHAQLTRKTQDAKFALAAIPGLCDEKLSKKFREMKSKSK